MNTLDLFHRLFALTLESSLYASALILLLLLLRPWLKIHLAPRWLYLLWLLVAARLLFLEIPSFPLLPSSPLPDPGPAIHQTFSSTLSPATSSGTPASAAKTWHWQSALPWLWACGMITVAASSLHAFFRWKRVIRHAEPVGDESILLLFEECREKLHLLRPVELLQIPGDFSPCVTGLYRPTLLLSKHHLNGLAPLELRWIFLHELAHIKRGDLIAQAVCWLLQILHWFNPLVWAAFSLMRHDREMACDAHVTELENSDQRLSYGATLVKIAESCPESPWTPGFLGITEESSPLKDRLTHLARHRPVTFGAAVAAILLCFVLAGVFLTKSPPASLSPKNQAVDLASPKYYRLQFLIVRLPPTGIAAFKETLAHGSLDQILAVPGVSLFASPETNISSNKTAYQLASHETIAFQTAPQSSSREIRDCGWTLQITTSDERNRALRDAMHLNLDFGGTVLSRPSNPDDPGSYPPPFATITFPFDGVIPLGRYQLLGTTNLATGASYSGKEAGLLLAIVVKAEENEEPLRE